MEKVDCKFLSKSLFPTLVGIYNFGSNNHDLNISLVEDSLKEQQLDPQGISYSNFKGWHSKFGIERKYKSFQNLKFLIETSVKHYCNFYGYNSNIVCENLWANLNKRECLNNIHHHGDSYLTGVYYPARCIANGKPIFNYTNSEESLLQTGYCPNNVIDSTGNLYFLSPSYSESRLLRKEYRNQYNADVYHMFPTASVLLVFPSHLLHGVNPFSEDHTRISISFNVKCNE